MAGLWSLLQAAGLWGILLLAPVLAVVFFGVHALNAQALDKGVERFELRIPILGIFIRWSRNAQVDAEEEPPTQGVEPPASPGEIPPPAAPPSSSGGGPGTT